VVLQLKEAGKKKEAEKRLREFHAWMKGLRFLDPACGSGNFLYVTMHLVKRIEVEVLRELEDVTGRHELLFEEVHPKQFHGIEIKLWAREIAELVLWIGYHQFWKAHHAHRPQEPILEDTGTIECRDAVLAWDEIRHDPSRDRPDPTPRVKHPVTGKMVPDPNAMLKYMEYVNPRPAEWPKAEFIIGNPPYLGAKRMRDGLGDGYVDAVRGTYSTLPESADYVLHWWARAADLVAAGAALRAGLITTNSITQVHQRPIVERAFDRGARPCWAIADHPWVDEADGAAVRVAMTVLAREPASATLVRVSDAGDVIGVRSALRLNPDFSAHADVASAAGTPLLANEGVSSMGFALYGPGFIIEKGEAEALLAQEPRNRWVLRPYRNRRDLAARPRGVFVVDFGYMSEDEAREYPVLFDMVRTRVKPDRDANRRDTIREFWWRFGWPRRELRQALQGLARFVATPETAKHRYSTFLDIDIAPDNKLLCVAVDSSLVLGVLSSRVHVEWSLAAGSRLGVGNDPIYSKTLCLDPFPFPHPTPTICAQIGMFAENLDAHRKAAIERDEAVTMTGMYNVAAKLRSGEALNPKERKIHEIAACGVLKDLHDELDVLVAQAYGWEWPLEKEVILERLVALHDERVAEEKAGKVRWLRPDYQIPRFGKDLPTAEPGLALPEGKQPAAKKAKRPAWPADVISQIQAIKRLLGGEALSAAEIAARFAGAKAEIVRRHVDILLVMGEILENPDGRYQGAA
jgi:hypothetical protein